MFNVTGVYTLNRVIYNCKITIETRNYKAFIDLFLLAFAFKKRRIRQPWQADVNEVYPEYEPLYLSSWSNFEGNVSVHHTAQPKAANTADYPVLPRQNYHWAIIETIVLASRGAKECDAGVT